MKVVKKVFVVWWSMVQDRLRERKLKRYIKLARSVDLPPLYIPRNEKDDRGC